MTLWSNRRPSPASPRMVCCPAQSLVVTALFAFAWVVFAPPQAAAVVHASIIVDAGTGQVLAAHNADLRAHPASLTKLMTLYITFERLRSGKLTLSQELAVSRHAAAQQPTRLGLRPGSALSVRAAILGIVTKSANDAAVVLAEAIAGSETRFAGLMNRTAQRLGMSHTVFYNASGLPDARQWTTARDMSKLALAILANFPSRYHFFAVRSFRFEGRIVYGHDHLLGRYEGADGLKTGYIRSSGYNLVSSAVRNHRRLVGVVLGGASAAARDRLMMALLDRGFATKPGEEQAAVPSMQRPPLKQASDAIPDSASRPETVRGWVVQIGRGFSSRQSVRRALRSAARTAPSSLRRSNEQVVRLSAGAYRARFSGLTETEAGTACRTLRRRGFTCRTFRNRPAPAADGQDLAASGKPLPAEDQD